MRAARRAHVLAAARAPSRGPPELQAPAARAPRRAERAGNAAFAAELTRWAFHGRGVLRAGALRHRHAGAPADGPQPRWYRITDVIAVELDIQELSGGAWVPYQCAPGLRAWGARGCVLRRCAGSSW